MTYFVTGATGFIGRHLVERLLEREGDISADETTNALLNVGGTQNAVDLANALGAKRFHHMSSIAVAGSYDGWFTEDDFDEGQDFPSPYHRTKFESEKLARE